MTAVPEIYSTVEAAPLQKNSTFKLFFEDQILAKQGPLGSLGRVSLFYIVLLLNILRGIYF